MERTFHGLRAVDKYILATSAVESLPPQVEVVNLTPVICGELRGQKRWQASVIAGWQAVIRVSWVCVLLLSNQKCKLKKQGFKITTTETTGSNNTVKFNDNKSCCQVQLK